MIIEIEVIKNEVQVTNCSLNYFAKAIDWDLDSPTGYGATYDEAVKNLHGAYELIYDGELSEGEEIILLIKYKS